MKSKTIGILFLVLVMTLSVCTVAFGATSKDMTATAMKGTPVIDGVIDSIWSKTETIALDNYTQGSKDINASATCKIMWDENNLYFLANVKDQIVINVNPEKPFNGDCFEMFIDELNEKFAETWDTNDGQYLVTCDGVYSVHPKKKGGGYDERSPKYKATKNDNGYVIEFAYPWVELKGKAAVGKEVGLQLQVDDDSMAAGVRDGAMTWPIGGHTFASDWGTVKLIAASATATPKASSVTATPKASSVTATPKASTIATPKPAANNDNSNTTSSNTTDTNDANPVTGDSSGMVIAIVGVLLSSAVLMKMITKKAVQE